jgi:hypothetical protein
MESAATTTAPQTPNTPAQTAADAIEVAWDVGSFLAYGLGSLWTALLLLRVVGVPRWINVLGIVGGLAGFFWIYDFVPIALPLPGVLGPVNILATIVWMIALAAVLARATEP